MNYAAITNKGTRAVNEDACFIPVPEDRMPVVIISDGMGGYAGGEIASRMVVDGISARVRNHPDDFEDALSKAVFHINRDIFRKGQTVNTLRNMGATMIAAGLFSDHIIAEHIGDSRMYLLHDGILLQLSEDHSYVQYLIEQGKITREESLHHPDRHMITKAMGCDPIAETDHIRAEWTRGDILLLCTDGLYDSLDLDALREVLSDDSSSLLERAEQLVTKALGAGSADNITVVLAENN